MFLLELLFAGALICECTRCENQDDLPPPNFHPSCPEPQSWSGGNLWKPRGENSGKLVVLLRTSYPLFDTCSVKLKNGNREDMEYTGLSNGDRQTFRGRFSGGSGEYAGKKKNGGVRCWIGEQICEFPIPGPPKERHD